MNFINCIPGNTSLYFTLHTFYQTYFHHRSVAPRLNAAIRCFALLSDRIVQVSLPYSPTFHLQTSRKRCLILGTSS